jgi:hypothetical protein
MTRLQILLACVLLACFAAQIDLAHEHHCLIEKAACSTCRVVVAPFAATPATTTVLHVASDPSHAGPPPMDAHRASTALRDAFRLRAPPRS